MRILVTSVVLALMVAAAPRDCPGQTTIVFGTDDLSTSTVTTIDTGYFNGLPALLPAVLPADATFVPSFAGNLLSLQGKFWRYAFDLPHGFSDLAFSLSRNAKKRTIKKGKTEELKFHFRGKVAESGYDIAVTFTNGCVLQIAN
jgi:hypothetical protein